MLLFPSEITDAEIIKMCAEDLRVMDGLLSNFNVNTHHIREQIELLKYDLEKDYGVYITR